MKSVDAKGCQSKAEERRILIVKAEKALKKLIREFGEGAANQAFSTAVAQERRQTFCCGHQVKQLNFGSCIEKLKGKRPPVSKIPPASDHLTLWGKGGKPSLLASQPYKLSLDDLRQIVEHCDDLNLDVEIGAGLSWHFPVGRCWWSSRKKKRL